MNTKQNKSASQLGSCRYLVNRPPHVGEDECKHARSVGLVDAEKGRVVAREAKPDRRGRNHNQDDPHGEQKNAIAQQHRGRWRHVDQQARRGNGQMNDIEQVGIVCQRTRNTIRCNEMKNETRRVAQISFCANRIFSSDAPTNMLRMNKMSDASITPSAGAPFS